jgi:hypothetical protein
MRTREMAVIGAALSIINMARGDVAYFSGAAFVIPGDVSGAATLDLDGDGKVDFSFSSDPYICTEDYPVSFCTGDYFVQAEGSNAVLQAGHEAVIVAAGATIGGVAPSGAVWTNDPNGAVVAEAYFGSLLTTNPPPGLGGPLTLSNTVGIPASGWGGPLATAGSGYLGVTITRGDGTHYGWVHAWLPDGSAFAASPTIIDWAYETWPNTGIVAGAAPVALQAPPEVVRAGYLRLKWVAIEGFSYQAQYRNDLNSPVWTDMDFVVIATGTNVEVDVPLIGSGAGFYRIVRMP